MIEKKTNEHLKQRIVGVVVVFSLGEVRVIAADTVQVPMVDDDAVSASRLRNIIARNVFNNGIATDIWFNFCETQILSSRGHYISLFNVQISKLSRPQKLLLATTFSTIRKHSGAMLWSLD